MNIRVLQLTGLLAFLFLYISNSADAQWRKRKAGDDDVQVVSVYDLDTLVEEIPMQRKFWHENKIDDKQELADASDGSLDKIITIRGDSIYTRLMTEAIIEDIDRMQIMIENLPVDSLNNNDDYKNSVGYLNNRKLIYLRALSDLLQRYRLDMSPDGYYYKRLTKNMRELILADFKGEINAFVHNNISIYTLRNVQEILDTGHKARHFIYREMGNREPQIMIRHLNEFATHSYACDIIAAAARVAPNMVFSYATSTTYARYAVEKCPDPLVQTIVRIANQSKSPLRAMPFLNDIYTKKKTIEEIDKITADEDLFYKNLVRLKLENVELGGDTYTSELQYRGRKYVRDMNDLHDEKPAVRFRGINGMPPEVLYFIMVYGQDEIYTSSFLGTFERMLQRMDTLSGYDLLEKVHRDKFRTFIRMNAGYNTLTQFLNTMDSSKRTEVMRDFIAGLDEGKEDDLEDAVDVADAFGSIRDKSLAEFLRKEVKSNYERAYDKRSKKGVIVYGLLATLFEGTRKADNNETAKEQSDKLRLPPINLVPYNLLVNDSGIVYEQHYFYGDEDGRVSYASFLGNFRDASVWNVDKKEFWTTITSKKGKPVVIYANAPLEEPRDEEAISKLCEHLTEQEIKPTLVVHRGHSYHLPLTIERLNSSARVVMLGSCGGYHNLATVLKKSPDANIISSKQTGAMSVNDPIIKNLNDQLLAGKDINWISTWDNLNKYFNQRRGSEKEMFDDYVPPHKNLGMIFIKAYRRLFNADI